MAIIKKYPSKIVSIQNYIEGVYTLEIESFDKPFNYLPGQFLHFSLDHYDPSIQWPESRCFSIQSNLESKNIKITYAVKGEFTKQMEQKLSIGTEVWLKLPYGDLFTRSHNKTNTVFISGGTGITPFLSLFTHKSFNEYLNPRIYLGFRSKKYNIYDEEIDNSYNTSKIIKYFYENIDGILDIKEIYSKNGTLCDYFISGPPMMIGQFKKALIGNGLPSNRIFTDDWE